MGLAFAKYASPVKAFVIGRKRKYKCDSDEDMYKIMDEHLHSPKRKKLRTAEYIHQTLFKDGKNSDVTVLALGQSFSLHKVYLCQSPYFASMFSGSWLESTKNVIPIEIVDPLITVDSLYKVFGSLYLDEIILEPLGIISVLATATLFQLENIIEQCVEVMMETVNPKTVVEYYEASCEYGIQKVKDATFAWLEVNLLNFYLERPTKMKKFSTALMTKLISSSNLFVMQTEFSIYFLLRNWLYVNVTDDKRDEITAEDLFEYGQYFENREDKTPFLHTTLGKRYIEPFKALRLKHLLLHHHDIEVIHRDNIIPKNWLDPEILQQWYAMLRISQNADIGPKSCPDDIFLKECLRCGRVVENGNKQMWRWTGFHFGLDLVVITDGSMLWMKRNHRSENEQMLSFQTQRNFLIRATVASVNEQLQIRHTQTTGIKVASCSKNEEILLLTFDKDLKFPLLISVNLLLTSPDEANSSTATTNNEERTFVSTN